MGGGGGFEVCEHVFHGFPLVDVTFISHNEKSLVDSLISLPPVKYPLHEFLRRQGVAGVNGHELVLPFRLGVGILPAQVRRHRRLAVDDDGDVEVLHQLL